MTSPDPIPNHIHFVYGMTLDGSDRPFSIVHYLAMKSALDIHQPDSLFLHSGYEPAGPWWDIIAPHVTLQLVEVPTQVHQNPVDRPEHRSDLVRLDVLLEHGGIYLDLDTISVRSLQPLRRHTCVLGIETTPGSANHGLSNAVMMAVPGSAFLRRWKDNYRTFNQDYWSTHSVVLPRLLAKSAPPGELHIEPVESFHWPSWDDEGINAMFATTQEFPDAYVHHLWAGKTHADILSKLTAADILSQETTYNRLARPFLPGRS